MAHELPGAFQQALRIGDLAPRKNPTLTLYDSRRAPTCRLHRSLRGRNSRRSRGVHSELAISAPKLGLQKNQLPAGPHDRPFATAFTEFHGRHKTALDLYRGEPLPGLCERRHGDKDVDHCHSEPTLHIAKVILERGLLCKAQDNSASIEVSLFDRERRQCCAVRCGLTA